MSPEDFRAALSAVVEEWRSHQAAFQTEALRARLASDQAAAIYNALETDMEDFDHHHYHANVSAEAVRRADALVAALAEMPRGGS